MDCSTTTCCLPRERLSSPEEGPFKLVSTDKAAKAAAFSLSVISWNIEGLARNSFILKQLVNQFSAKLCFISEPQVFSCDLSSQIACFDGDFEFHPNSKDKDVHVMDLPLTYSRAIGGTMVIWQSSQSPPYQSAPHLVSHFCVCSALPSQHHPLGLNWKEGLGSG